VGSIAPNIATPPYGKSNTLLAPGRSRNRVVADQ